MIPWLSDLRHHYIQGTPCHIVYRKYTLTLYLPRQTYVLVSVLYWVQKLIPALDKEILRRRNDRPVMTGTLHVGRLIILDCKQFNGQGLRIRPAECLWSVGEILLEFGCSLDWD
ncbi:hypothetical protein BaRGS_00022427 [Batillaria attramentaria]|uniref:Uncharacterized protein n=1 Tax=Batillaria attramentaria TaxID=370345 RepID=A0ABD0KGU6_9CAEN